MAFGLVDENLLGILLLRCRLALIDWLLIAGCDLDIVLSVAHFGGEASSMCVVNTAYLWSIILIKKLGQAILLLLIIVLLICCIVIGGGICW